MRKHRPVFFPVFILLSSFFLLSWGYNGHYKISLESSKSFNQEMNQFMDWSTTLAAHASDADDRKDTDPYEGPRHYIDIDNYPGFLENGRIPQTYDSVVALYGIDFVQDQGILPWATVTTYDSLVECFLRRDWYKAVLFASDLGHYVADGYMPLHITVNYNGQNSGNNGIHSRYESSMINTFLGQMSYSGDSVSFVEDVNSYVFQYLYSNYSYVDSVLMADDYAQQVAGNTSSYLYKETLWNRTKGFTTMLYANASNTLAEMIYSAWVEAGKPSMNSSGMSDALFENTAILLQNYPNPFFGTTRLEIYLATDSQIKLEVMDITGKSISLLANGFLERGKHVFHWEATEFPAGVYFLALEGDGIFQARKMIVTR